MLTLALTAVLAVAGITLYVTSVPSSGQTRTSSSDSTVTVSAVPATSLVSPGETQNYTLIQVTDSATTPSGTLTLRAFPPSGISFVLNQTSVALSETTQSIPVELQAGHRPRCPVTTR